MSAFVRASGVGQTHYTLLDGVPNGISRAHTTRPIDEVGMRQEVGAWFPGEERRSLSAWATDRLDRKFVSRGCAFLYVCHAHSWSKKQPTVAFSSAEAELAALKQALAKAGYRDVLGFLGCQGKWP
eukprot:1713574-Amphidinium_carterae.2